MKKLLLLCAASLMLAVSESFFAAGCAPAAPKDDGHLVIWAGWCLINAVLALVAIIKNGKAKV